VFGATSPLLGERYRLEVSPTFGELRFTGILADYRRYFMPARPWTLAFRVLHFGRYGGSTDSRLQPLFIGYPNLVRGYDVNSFSNDECGPDPGSSCPVFEQLLGTKVLVGNVELRVPPFGLFGGRRLYGPLPLELFAFGDAGVAWTNEEKAKFLGGSGTREPVSSVGVGTRINVFGYAVVEIDFVRPLDRPRKPGWSWVFNFTPGF